MSDYETADKVQDKILLSKETLSKFVSQYDIIKEYPVPKELCKALGVENAFIKVRGASLDDHITANHLSSIPPVILVDIINALKNNDNIDRDKIALQIQSDSLHPNTFFELNLFQRCVVEPKISLEEVVFLSEVAPRFVSEICEFALLGITQF